MPEMTQAGIAFCAMAIAVIAQAIAIGLFLGSLKREVKHLNNAIYDNDGESKISGLATDLGKIEATLHNGLCDDVQGIKDSLQSVDRRLTSVEAVMNK